MIKQNATAERLAGFIKGDAFNVAYAFRTHEAYELELPKYDVSSAKKLKYNQWDIAENVGQAQSNDSDGLLSERDHLLAQNLELNVEIKNLKEVADDSELAALEKKEQVEALQQKIITLEQKNVQGEATQKQLKQQLNEIQQVAKKPTPKGFWSRLAYVFKASD